jgi:glucose/arabinose dehydrogenase
MQKSIFLLIAICFSTFVMAQKTTDNFSGKWKTAEGVIIDITKSGASFNGKPTGKWEVFANGFSGKSVVKNTRDAQHRPCGLAEGPDGSLYVSDDSKGAIFKISFNK